MRLTSQLRLLPTAEQAAKLSATMRAVNAAATEAARVGFKNGVFGQVSIHRLCYRDIRERFDLPANIAVRAIAKAVEGLAFSRGVCPEFAPMGAVPCSDRTYRIASPQVVSIAVLGGRIKVPYFVADYFKESLSQKRGEADLVYRDGKWFLCIAVEFDEPPPIEPKDWLGVDLGIKNLATDSTGEAFSGETVERNRRRRAVARKQYQRKGTKNAKRRLKRMAGRQGRFQAIVNHAISKRLVAKAKALGFGIAIEDLTGIRSRAEPTASKRFRQRLGNWAFAQLRRFVEYKAKRAGVPVMAVDSRDSSKTCSSCGHCERANRPSQSGFHCRHCGFSLNADHNAALNLRARVVSKPAPQAAGFGLAAKPSP